MNNKTYDQISWHMDPEKKSFPNMSAAKSHFRAIMGHLKAHNLLSEEGHEVLKAGIDSDFALHAGMLTPKGNQIMSKWYGQG